MKLADRRMLELLDRRSLNKLELSGKKVLVALSGGADSLALLRALVLYCRHSSIQLKAVHVNHGIRSESYTEEHFIVELCQSLGIDLRVHNLKLGHKPQRTSPEQFWRERRYEAFWLSVQELEADYLALGHTADDLAETFLYHLVRGTSPEGLAFNFLSRTEGDLVPILRPLWKTRRAEIEEALAGVHQEWVNDPSNIDLRYSRNRIRSQVIPALAHINPEAVTAIVGFADKLAGYVKKIDVVQKADLLELNITPDLRSMAYDGVCLTVRHFLLYSGKASHGTRHVEQAADMICESTSGLVALPDSKTLVLTQTNGWLYDGSEPTVVDLAREHCKRFHAFGADLSGRYSDAEVEIKAMDGQTYVICVEPSKNIQIRNRKPGDRVGQKSLKKLLIEYNVPWYIRDYLVLAVTAEGQVVDLLTEDVSLREWVKRRSVASVSLTTSKLLPPA